MNELVPMRLVTGWRVCMDYRKNNTCTQYDHFPMPFMDQMLDRLAGRGWYCFFDGGRGKFVVHPTLPRPSWGISLGNVVVVVTSGEVHRYPFL